jgi:hypothetical protein
VLAARLLLLRVRVLSVLLALLMLQATSVFVVASQV